ncbi:MAG: histidine phosphatase family protein [Rhodospirillales bacterium]|nr:histidine phosphatase family protein [Rhodospirillales bacterium]
MTTRVLLVRHGATVLSAEDRFAGATDVDLSDEGRHQARCLAERLASVPLAAVYASPLKRTVETATLIAEPHALPLRLDDGLREIDHGHWEEMHRTEVEAQFPDEYAAWEEDPFTFAPEGGEAGLNVLARALPVIRRIVIQHAEETVLVVSHKATIRLVLSSLLGFDARGYRDRLDQHPCCLNIVDFRDPVRARLMLFNDASHYENLPEPMADAHLTNWWARHDADRTPGIEGDQTDEEREVGG